MGFTLKIYFLGLIAFLPTADGDRMTVFLVDARNAYSLSDGSVMEPHEPLLMVRGPVRAIDGADDREHVARTMFPDDYPLAAEDLEAALAGGAVWRLRGADLVLDAGPRTPEHLLSIRRTAEPTTATPWETDDFAWVAEMARIAPTASTVDPDLRSESPRKRLIAARLELDRGEIYTERLVEFDRAVVEAGFRTLRDGESVIEYVQPLADRVVAEIAVAGCSVTIGERPFHGGEERAIEITPESCTGDEVVEIALINLPVGSFGARSPVVDPDEVGKHFEIFYELAYLRPPSHLRPVPFLASRVTDRQLNPGRSGDPSELLTALGLPGRSAHSRPMCPMTQFTLATDE